MERKLFKWHYLINFYWIFRKLNGISLIKIEKKAKVWSDARYIVICFFLIWQFRWINSDVSRGKCCEKETHFPWNQTFERHRHRMENCRSDIFECLMGVFMCFYRLIKPKNAPDRIISILSTRAYTEKNYFFTFATQKHANADRRR